MGGLVESSAWCVIVSEHSVRNSSFLVNQEDRNSIWGRGFAQVFPVKIIVYPFLEPLVLFVG